MKRKLLLSMAMSIVALLAVPVIASACDQSKSDEFTGASLDLGKWSLPYWNSTSPFFQSGHLTMQIASSGIEAAAEEPMGLVAQTLPEGDEWTVETKITSNVIADAAHPDGYAQVGMMIYQSTANWMRIGHTRVGIHHGDPPAGSNTYFEFTHETNDVVTYGVGTGLSPSNPLTWWMQMRRDGNNITGWYAITDPTGNPAAWNQIPGELDINAVLPGTDPVFIGLHNGVGGFETAAYDYFRITCPGGGEPPVDTTPPELSHVVEGTVIDETTFEGPVTVHLFADDEESGIESHEYRIDGGDWIEYSGSFQVAESGDHVIDHRSTDGSTNVANDSFSFTIVEETIVEPPPPTAPRLAVKLAKKNLKIGAKKKNAKVTVTVRNTGNAVARVKVCAKAPKKRVGISGNKCKIVNVAAGASRKVNFKLKAKKKLRGKKAKVTITSTAPGAKSVTVRGSLKQRKK